MVLATHLRKPPTILTRHARNHWNIAEAAHEVARCLYSRDLNFAAGQVEVRQNVKRINNEWTVGTPKSSRSTHNVPLVHRGLMVDLRWLVLAQPNSGDPDALFWPGWQAHSHILDYSQQVNVRECSAITCAPRPSR